MFPAATTEGGTAMCLAPDVCFIPAPPPPPAGVGGIPTPFPNIGSCSSAKKTTKKVFIRNKLVLIEGSEIPSSKGDEAGCSTIMPPGQKGIVSMKNMAKVVFKKHSSKVIFEKKGVVYLTVPTTHNKDNTMGSHLVPSQTCVFVCA